MRSTSLVTVMLILTVALIGNAVSASNPKRSSDTALKTAAAPAVVDPVVAEYRVLEERLSLAKDAARSWIAGAKSAELSETIAKEEAKAADLERRYAWALVEGDGVVTLRTIAAEYASQIKMLDGLVRSYWHQMNESVPALMSTVESMLSDRYRQQRDSRNVLEEIQLLSAPVPVRQALDRVETIKRAMIKATTKISYSDAAEFVLDAHGQQFKAERAARAARGRK